nr:hypothetical protein [candidate division Zixibacteria bacterium]
MAKCLIIYEDHKYEDFYPLTWIRPVFFLRPGIRSIFEKVINSFGGYAPYLFCRPEIAQIAAEQTRYPVNDFEDKGFDEIIFVNGAIRPNLDFFEALKKAGRNVILQSGEDVAAFKMIGTLPEREYTLLKNGDLGGFFDKFRQSAETMDIEINLYGHLWDLVDSIESEIKDDFEYFRHQNDDDGFLISYDNMEKRSRIFPGVNFLGVENIYIASDASVLPGNVIDASAGPIFVGSKVRIEPHTYLVGPTYIGRESHLVGGKITASSIGPVCRVGGELEESIIQGYTNKYHAGFVGHAYLGEWINLGAMTTNSDLKNNYATVSSYINGQKIDTGRLKVGSFIGDFTRTAIGTLLNTGINIGICCNLISDGIITDGEIPPFTWYSPRHKMNYSFVKAMETIDRAMSRRDMKLSDAMRKRLENISVQALDKQK